MSDRDRPRFLPPEEPPAEPPAEPADDAPMLPWGQRPPGPARGVMILVAAAGVSLLVAVGGLAFLRSGGPSLAHTGPSPTVASGPEFASVPDPCEAAAPADVRSARPRHFKYSCSWEILRPDRSRSLEVEFQLERSDPGLGTSGSVGAARDFADDLAYAADGGRNGGFESDPGRLDTGGTADEAFAAHATNLIVSGPTERTATSYDMGGALVELRRNNVVLTVKWRGADYPASVRGRQKLVGTRLPYPAARQQALSIANGLMERLH